MDSNNYPLSWDLNLELQKNVGNIKMGGIGVGGKGFIIRQS